MAQFREQMQHPENCYDVQSYEQVGRCTQWYNTVSMPSTSQLWGHTEKLQNLATLQSECKKIEDLYECMYFPNLVQSQVKISKLYV